MENLKRDENCDYAMAENMFADEDSNLTDTIEETAKYLDKPKKSLPYFEMPNPNLEQYILETSQTLAVGSKPNLSYLENCSTKEMPSNPTVIHDSITFEIVEQLKPIDRFKSKFISQVHEIQKQSCTSKESSKIIPLDDMAPPGSKHLILREILKRKMAEKKILCFKRMESPVPEEEISEDSNDSEEEIQSPSDGDIDAIDPLEPKESIDTETQISCVSDAPFAGIETPDTGTDSSSLTNPLATVIHENHGYEAKKGDQLESNCDLNNHSTEKIDDDALHKSSKDINYFASDTDSDCEDVSSKKKSVPLADVSDEESINDEQFFLASDQDVEKRDSSQNHFITKSILNPSDHEALKVKLLNERINSQDFQSDPVPIETDDEGNISLSDIPSYQPNGGFRHQDYAEKCIPDSGNSIQDSEGNDLPRFMIQSSVSCVKDLNKNSNCFENRFLEGKQGGIADCKLDDLSVCCNGSQYSYDDVESICSGFFPDSSGDDKNIKPEIVHGQPTSKVWDYFEDEAELSGDDHGSDADLDEEYGDVEDEMDVITEEGLPSSEEQRREIADLFMKRIRDDDVKDLRDIKERFLEGELGDQSGRSRKFVWSKANADAIDDQNQASSSDTDAENVSEKTEKWSFNVEKTKWQMHYSQDETEENVLLETESLNSQGKIKSGMLKMKTQQHLRKRTRGSALSMDESLLKKFRLEELDS